MSAEASMNPAGLRQPDQRSCGATVAVVARMLADPSYAERVRPRFAAEVLGTHRRLTRPRLRGRLQVPWPRALGTPPWAVTRELTALTGVRHRTRLVRWRRPPGGDDVAALYVGDRWLPRHVVLVVGHDPVRCYDPARGRVVEVDPAALARRRPFGRWTTVWFALSPSGRRSRA
ncbi:hypothetical protein [Nocardioides dongxiaopingii]|uniref:hypothetical protein n=1 Tax=Nocardioides dongxiaopingii TaxID=2576036 RepID=UPI0010C7619E|nr:hypothetical protein [Nocardioides dongxiaopingii]